MAPTSCYVPPKEQNLWDKGPLGNAKKVREVVTQKILYFGFAYFGNKVGDKSYNSLLLWNKENKQIILTSWSYTGGQCSFFFFQEKKKIHNVALLFCLLRKFAKGKPPTFFITPCEAGQKGGKAKKQAFGLRKKKGLIYYPNSKKYISFFLIFNLTIDFCCVIELILIKWLLFFKTGSIIVNFYRFAGALRIFVGTINKKQY